MEKTDAKKIIRLNLAKRANISVDSKTEEVVWNKDLDWQNWDFNRKKDKTEICLEQFVRSSLKYRHNPERNQFYELFYEKNLKIHFEDLVETLQRKCVKIAESKSEKSFRIIPSVFNLFSYLLEQNQPFNVFIRTFGPEHRLDTLAAELNDFWRKNNQDARIIGKDNFGVIHRDNYGPILALGQTKHPNVAIAWCKRYYAENFSNTEIKPVGTEAYVKSHEDQRQGRAFLKESQAISIHDGIREIYEKFRAASLSKQSFILRDDFSWWKANNEEHHCGKPLLVDLKDESIHPIIFDDNIWDHVEDPKIVDVVSLEEDRESKLPFEVSNNTFLVCANTLLALYDDDYFIKLVQKCQQNRVRLEKSNRQ